MFFLLKIQRLQTLRLQNFLQCSVDCGGWTADCGPWSAVLQFLIR